MSPTLLFSCERCELFKNSFFSRTPPVTAFVSTRKGRRGKRGTKEHGKNVQMKEKNENISLNFYLQVLVLVKTVMQIQLCKYYRTAHSLFFTFFQIFFLVIPACSFFVFSFLINWKISLAAFVSIFRSRHWELFRKIVARQDISKTVNFFTKLELVFSTIY